MTRYLVCEHNKQANHAGTKARNDIVTILTSHGWEPLYVSRGEDGNSLAKIAIAPRVVTDWKRIEAKLCPGDVLMVQYPLAMYPQVSRLAQRPIANARRKGAHIVYLIHDLDSLRGVDETVERGFLSLADAMIVHNERMVEHLRGKGYNVPMVSIGLFDYVIPEGVEPAEGIGGIDIAGNLGPQKAAYVYQLSSRFPDACFNLYGPFFDKSSPEAKWYRGSFAPEELPAHLTGTFGLVWDGESIDTCTGEFGEYLRYNNPHKCSLYLACGKPVVVWDESALAPFVSGRGLGVVASSVEEAIHRIGSLTETERLGMQQCAREESESLRAGRHTLKAAENVCNILK